MLNEIKNIYQIGKIILKSMAGIVCIIFAFELLKMLIASFDASIYLGISVSIFMIGALVYIVFRIKILVKQFPELLEPPNAALTRNVVEYLKEYSNYLTGTALRLIKNPNIDGKSRSELEKWISEINELKFETTDAYRDKLAKLKNNAIEPALDNLKKGAQDIVQKSVRDNMLGVIILPLKSLDAIFLIYRLGKLFFNVVHHYRQRPLIREIWIILRDVINLILISNVLNYGGKSLEKLAKKIPFLDSATYEIVQSIGIGLFTTALGNSIIQRCNTVEIWEQEQQENVYKKTSKDFPVIVFRIFRDDVYQSLAQPLKNAWQKMRSYFVEEKTREEHDAYWGPLFRG